MKVTGTNGKEYTMEPEADLVGADLKRANLSGAVWNDETVFPEGFEIPEKSELRLLRRRL
tara:strand:- start:170 stop:349 length:180 start_codon:yes stop_codon:yes gene_type:complete